jgi:hypothetical protein
VAEDPGESVFGGIKASSSEKHLHKGIAINDFSMRSEPLIGGTRGERSRGVRVRHFRIFGVKRIAYVEITIHDFPIGLKAPSGGQVSER